MRRININFEEFAKVGNDYCSYSTELQEIIKNIEESRKRISDNWKSDNAITFDALLGNFINKIKMESNKYQRYGKTIIGVSTNFKDKDIEYAKTNNVNLEEIYDTTKKYV